MTEFNATVILAAEVLDALFASTASSVVPLLLLESVLMGALCACVPLVSYLLWVKPHSLARVPFISIVWLVLIVVVTHWVLSFRQLESMIVGRFLGYPFPPKDLTNITISPDRSDPNVLAYYAYGEAWQFLLPLITETILFGLSSSLFAIMVYTNLRHSRSHWRSWFALIIPVMASLMYTLSLSHWAVSLRVFTTLAEHATVTNANKPLSVNINVLNVALLSLLSINAIMSDSIVLWRMCIVWGRARTACVFAVVLLFATFGLDIADIVLIVRGLGAGSPTGGSDTQSESDAKIVSSYGRSNTGLAAAFLSLTLASNLCATLLVGLKAWLHRWSLSREFQSITHRTQVQRVMELFTESGVVYTALWLLYCVSFFRSTTSQATTTNGWSVTAISHLDAAMAQITAIYPLMIFILVALDKIHHSQGPETLRGDERSEERKHVASISIAVSADSSTAHGSNPDAYPMEPLHRHNNGYPSPEDQRKLRAPESHEALALSIRTKHDWL